VPASASVPSSAQESSEIVIAQLLGTSLFDDLPIALRKGKHTYTQHPLFNFISYSHLSSSFRSFIIFFGLIHDSQECIRSNVYSKLDSGDAGGDDSLRAK